MASVGANELCMTPADVARTCGLNAIAVCHLKRYRGFMFVILTCGLFYEITSYVVILTLVLFMYSVLLLRYVQNMSWNKMHRHCTLLILIINNYLNVSSFFI